MALLPVTRNRFFGAPGRVAKTTVMTPWGIRAEVHQAVAGVFLAACHEAYATCSWRPRRCDSYANRAIRGSYNPSLHSYALAWDFFATPPTQAPPGGVWTPYNAVPANFAACFIRRGFTWGAYWKRRDVPHIEWSGPPPGAYIPYTPPVAAAPGGFLMALSDSQQGELYNVIRNDHGALQALRVKVDELERKIDAQNEASIAHRYEMRNTLAALIRRLFGVDEVRKNDSEPFWKKAG